MLFKRNVLRAIAGAWTALFTLSTIAQTVPATVFSYDSAGRVAQVTLPMGQVNEFAYNSDNLLVTHSQPNPNGGGTLGQVNYGYNGQLNLTSVSDPRGLTTTYGIDGLGETSSVISPDTGSATYSTDAAGRLTSRANARGSVSFIYDALDRPLKIDYGDEVITLGYDETTNGIGQLTSMADSSGSTLWDYDKLGRVTSKRQTTDGVTLSAAYAYSGGRLTSITYPSGAVVTFGYSGAQVSSIAVNGNTVISNVVYAPFGAPLSWTMGGIGSYSRTIDGYGRITSYTYDGGNRILEWDASSRLTALTNPDGSRWTYSYDNLDRLTSATESSVRSFQYDLTGNRTTESINGVAYGYSVTSGANKLGSSASPSESRSYTYDGVGNITSDGIRGFTWNNAGQLTSSAGPAGAASYAYNGLGQRVKKASSAGARYFFYAQDGVSLLGEYGPAGAGATHSETVYMDGVPVLVLRGGSVYYVLPDHLNTPRVVKSSAGVTVWKWHSDAFGAVGPNENPGGVSLFNWNARFPGQYFDSETGLYYNNARYYDPQTGRYYSSDPIGLEGGLNTYAYAGGSPATAVDPSGNIAWVPVLLGAWFAYDLAVFAKNNFFALCNPSWRETAVEGGLLIAGIVPLGKVSKIGGRLPINYRYAGKTYHLKNELALKYPNGVKFNEYGFPDFSPYATHTVELKRFTSRPNDFREANKLVGFSERPRDMTWHHVEDGKTLQLVPWDLHNEVKHLGGIAVNKHKGSL